MKYFYLTLVLLVFSVWLCVFNLPDNFLHIVACDVGQGDAILIYRKNTQILIDGGPNNKVLDCLNRHLSFFDREIELVVLTHPQADHYMGLIDVFKNYKIKKLLKNDLKSSSSSYQVLESLVGSGQVETLTPFRGLKLGNSLIYLEVVHPSKDFISDRDINDYSIVTHLVFGEFDALFTGDLEDKKTQLAQKTIIPKVEYLKVPHHGSKNGLTKELLEAADPQIAVISVGKNNRYNHPHQEILDLLKSFKVKTLRTDEIGDVEITTDGNSWWLK